MSCMQDGVDAALWNAGIDKLLEPRTGWGGGGMLQ
jgi:hypothetical protein